MTIFFNILKVIDLVTSARAAQGLMVRATGGLFHHDHERSGMPAATVVRFLPDILA